jgi:hypothetical protein
VTDEAGLFITVPFATTFPAFDTEKCSTDDPSKMLNLPLAPAVPVPDAAPPFRNTTFRLAALPPLVFPEAAAPPYPQLILMSPGVLNDVELWGYPF